MKYLAFNDSEILREFGRIMGEQDGLKKTAQIAQPPLSEDEKVKLQKFLADLQSNPSNGPGMERWIARLKGQPDLYLGAVHKALSDRYLLWSEGKDAQELTSVLIPTPANEGLAAQPVAPVAQNTLSPKGAEVVEAHEKTAEGKSYQVVPEENEVLKAHPQSAYVEGELVENKDEQQKADVEVAEKDAKGKEAKAILTALYKLAKKLEADGEDEAYKLVVATFKDIKNGLKK
jgi:hypothetical protein